MYIQRHRVYAEDMIDDSVIDEGTVDVAPEATDLLFEAEDVAELVAEVTGDPVEVVVDDDNVTFSVDGEDFTVEPEGNEEILEAATSVRRKRKVSASTRRKVAASRQVATRRTGRNARTVRRISR